MNPFLATSSSIELLVLVLVATLIVALHRLKPRPARRSVASTWLWQAAARRVGQRPASWRWWLALGFSLAIGTLLTLALTRPELQGLGDGSRRVVLVLDNGPTMAVRTRDGQTRWAHALATARSVIAGARGPVMVMDSTGRVGPTRFLEHEEAIQALERLAVVAEPQRALPPVPAAPGTELHYIGDGVASPRLPSTAIVHSVFEAADNVAVVRLVARALPADPLRVDAFVQVVNASAVAKAVRLTLRGGDRYAVSQDLRMAPGELVDATFDVSAFEGGVLAAAAITQGDAFAPDDIAYAIVQPHRVRSVQLVTRGNSVLADALAALPGMRIQVVSPEQYRHSSGADAYVFDDFTPSQPPSAGGLLFHPGVADWLPPPDRNRGPVAIDRWDRASPLASGIAWDAVSIGRASPWTRWPKDVTAVARTGDGAMVLSGRNAVSWTAVAFRPGDSDLPLQPAFTVFLGNALAQLMAPDSALVEPLGPIRIALGEAQVHDGHGRRVESRSIPGATLFSAERPDIYTVRSAHAQVVVAAGVLDPRLAEVNATRFADEPRAQPPLRGLPIEGWMLIALACIALLLIDWAAYMRRVTR